MKVIVASFPKCGTKTLHVALEMLGYKVHDFDDHLYQFPEEWLDILKHGSKREVLKKMYDDIDVVCDMPAAFYWEELLEAFPDAKVILTMRSSEDEWYDSYKYQVDALHSSNRFLAYHAFTPTGRKAREVITQLGYVVYSCPPQPFPKFLQNPNVQIQKRRYREHNDGVLKRSPKDQTLVFNLSDGWKPICEFLAKDIPDTPFPHENQKGALSKTLSDLPLFIQIEKEFRLLTALLVILIAGIAAFPMLHLL